MNEHIKTEFCKTCKNEIYEESIETYQVDQMGNSLYDKVWVCPNGCDGFNSKDCKGVIDSYKSWLKEQIEKHKQERLSHMEVWVDYFVGYGACCDWFLSLLEEKQ